VVQRVHAVAVAPEQLVHHYKEEPVVAVVVMEEVVVEADNWVEAEELEEEPLSVRPEEEEDRVVVSTTSIVPNSIVYLSQSVQPRHRQRPVFITKPDGQLEVQKPVERAAPAADGSPAVISIIR